MKDIKGIVFDKDGVLFDTEMIITDCWRIIGERENIGNVIETLLKCIGLNRNDTCAVFEETYGNTIPFLDLMEEASEMSRARIRKEGLPVKKGAYEILQFLRETSYQVALASSSKTDTVYKHLRDADMTEYFENILGGDSLLHSKPQPDIYLNICKKMGLKPQECIAIEDSPNGIISAYRAGMKVVMVPDLIQPSEEIEKMLYKKFDSLFEVKEYIEKARRG